MRKASTLKKYSSLRDRMTIFCPAEGIPHSFISLDYKRSLGSMFCTEISVLSYISILWILLRYEAISSVTHFGKAFFWFLLISVNKIIFYQKTILNI